MAARRLMSLMVLFLGALACDAVRPVKSAPPIGLALCTRCHGDVGRGNAAPPRSSTGAIATTDPSVGAHQSHLVAGHFRSPIACQECHQVPRTVDEQGHMLGVPATVRFDAPGSSGLARARGAAAGVTFALLDTATPRARPDALCNVYCHGATLDGGKLTRPGWAGSYDPARSTLDCSSCHGFPPGGRHPQDFERTPDAPARACSRCHSHTVASEGTLDLAGGKHLDGLVEFGGEDACKSCHGNAARQASPGSDPLVAAAPPRTINGASAGAHLAHVNGAGTALRGPLACAECHARSAEEMAGQHPDGTVDVDFGPLASAASAAPAWDAAAGSCAATYCHGATLGGGTQKRPRWTGGPDEAACGTCHGVPPPSPHVQNKACGSCHPGYTSMSVDAAKHVNGALEVVPLTCTTCHGNAAQTATQTSPLYASPPMDTAGLTSSPAVGAHQAHLTRSDITTPIACSECHQVPASIGHANGTLDFAFAGRAVQGDVKPTYAGGTCSATYCHGNYEGTFTYAGWNWALDQREDVTVSYVGKKAAPGWVGAPMACDSCHGNPPPTGIWHSPAHGGGSQCELCHPDAAGNGVGTSITNSALHVNGTVDVTPKFTASCFGCH